MIRDFIIENQEIQNIQKNIRQNEKFKTPQKNISLYLDSQPTNISGIYKRKNKSHPPENISKIFKIFYINKKTKKFKKFQQNKFENDGRITTFKILSTEKQIQIKCSPKTRLEVYPKKKLLSTSKNEINCLNENNSTDGSSINNISGDNIKKQRV